MNQRVCLLTGASGFFGKLFINQYFKKYQIVAIYNNTPIETIPEIVDPLQPYSSARQENVFPVHGDLSSQQNIDALVDIVLNQFGKVDFVVNAAVYRNWQHMLAPNALDYGEWHFSINVLAPLRLASALANKFWIARAEENLVENRHVLNVSSTAGSYVYPDSGQILYSASKAALNYASYHMASELWEMGVRVNTIAPNTFPGIVPIERLMREIDKLEKSTQTGQLVIIDR